MSDLLNQRIKEVVESKGYHVFDIQWTKQSNNRVLQIACGKDDFSMDLDGCTMLSDVISTMLDEEFEELSDYFLEICSPGAERELTTMADRLLALHHKVYIRLEHPINKSLEFIGMVDAIDADQLVLTYRDKARSKTITVPTNEIAFMRLAV